MINRTWKAIATAGLTKEQKKLIADLAELQVSFLQDHRDDIEITGAGMMGYSIGLAVVTKKLEQEQERKKKVKEITQKCREKGIKEWRIKLVL